MKILIGFLYFTETMRSKLPLLCTSFLLCMDLQPYSHDCFSKISRTLFDFRNNTYWVSFFLEKQLANILDRGFLFLRNTLSLYSISPYWRTERQTETQIHSLRVGWRNLFSICAVVSVFVLAGNRFWFYILLMHLEYHTVVCGGK